MAQPRKNKPTQELTLFRELQAWGLRCRGLTVESIGEEMDLDPSAVYKILNRIGRGFKAGGEFKHWMRRGEVRASDKVFPPAGSMLEPKVTVRG